MKKEMYCENQCNDNTEHELYEADLWECQKCKNLTILPKPDVKWF